MDIAVDVEKGEVELSVYDSDGDLITRHGLTLKEALEEGWVTDYKTSELELSPVIPKKCGEWLPVKVRTSVGNYLVFDDQKGYVCVIDKVNGRDVLLGCLKIKK